MESEEQTTQFLALLVLNEYTDLIVKFKKSLELLI